MRQKMMKLAGVILWASAEAMAQDDQSKVSRRIVVSIPDRKLAVIEKSSKPITKPTAKRRPIRSQTDVNFHAAQGIVGLFKSGAHDLAKNHDGYLYR